MVQRDTYAWYRYERVWKLRQMALSLEDVAKFLGVTRERVRQMEHLYATKALGLHGPWLSSRRPLHERTDAVGEHRGRYLSP